MSGTVAPQETAPPPLPSDRLVTPQTVIAFLGMLMAFSIVWKILYNGSETLQSQVLMLAQNLVVAIIAFYFGSSKGSADKDAKPTPPPLAPIVMAAPAPAPAPAAPAVTIGTVNNEAAPPPNQGTNP